MNTIYKYRVNPGNNAIALPAKHKIISVGVDSENIPVIWAEVSDSSAYTHTNINLFATGETLPENPGRFLGTITQSVSSGLTEWTKTYIWHAYLALKEGES